MLKVECESCKSPYQVDERRVPPTGLKMRCPKCGASFVVNVPAKDAGAELPAVARPKAQPPQPSKPLLQGADLPASLGARAPARPGAPVGAAPPAVAAKPAAPPPAAEASLEEDLPAVLSAGLPTLSAALPARSGSPFGASASSASGAHDFGIELPSPAGNLPSPKKASSGAGF